MNLKNIFMANQPKETQKLLKRLSFGVIFLSIFIASSSFSIVKNQFTASHDKVQSLINFDYSSYSKYKPLSDDLPNWALLDPEKDGYEGTSTLAFYEYVASLNSAPQRNRVIVAVIDSGFDIDHPALKDNIWKNEAEVNGIEGVDDDGNGYVDDFNGWNFLGDLKYSNLEVTREYYRLKKENASQSDPYFQKVLEEYNNEKDEVESTLEGISETYKLVNDAADVLERGNYPTDVEKLMAVSDNLKDEYRDAANILIGAHILYGLSREELAEIYEEYKNKDKYLFKNTDISAIIGDDPAILSEKGYGNNNVKVEGESHGTHVAGIVAAKKEGIGQAPFATIIPIRAVPNEGDERDKDIGNAIRYAVDNGAQIINMSAGKYFSPNPEYVVDAINYAEERGVLFVISAGNEGSDIETVIGYPRKFYTENGEIKHFENMIVVGASTWMQKWNEEKDPDNLTYGYDLAASFSNYSGKIVDVFAPGMEINSTVPGGKYKRISGTSMASPEVAGIAAVIKAYFPEMTPNQIKELLVNSVRKYDGLKVKLRDKAGKVYFSDLSRSGGVVDLLKAFKMAEQKYQ